MFSGIIEELGQLKRRSLRGQVALFEITAKTVLEGTVSGDSIAVNGVCLTVIEKEKDSLSFEVMQETLDTTNLGTLRVGEKVNLERSLKLGERLSGHFVTGHVDCPGVIRHKAFVRSNLCFQIAIPSTSPAYLVPKGSVAVDGISLTVMNVRGNSFDVYVIPHTLKNTTLGFKGPSDRVNVEFDMLIKAARPC